MTDRLRLALIGAGWITPMHLAAFERLGRTTLVGVSAVRLESARATAAPRGAAAYTDAARMLDAQRPDIVYVCVPPSAAIATLEVVVERGLPFLTEKPLAAMDAEGPVRIADAVAARGLIAAAGYHMRALEAMPEVQERLAADPARLVVARWMDGTPAPAWWLRAETGGGQVVEQITHLYDLGRLLVGEAVVVGAASLHEEPVTPPWADVADATAAVLRYETGAVGSFANTRRMATHLVDMEFTSDGLRTTIRRPTPLPGPWEIAFIDGTSIQTLPPGRDPYEIQAERFLDAVEANDPSKLFSTYADALRTDRLTRAVVAATGRPG
ncbi:MAG: Gfo/Idh/MocA family oxidoreductase [Chloroflexi bacterium]|nr:Gfo/Idh/MocA family oxidoreductase [Chloroflexota bacterium]